MKKDQKLIQQGAEAKIYEKKETIIKNRFKKEYRNEILDEKIRKFRTKRESKVIQRLIQNKISVPKLISQNDFNIEMEKIKGKQLNIYLGNTLNKEKEKILVYFGKIISKIHDLNIIHGDLTTSNMIITKEKKLFVIDFGLSFFSDKIEDKAVDIHLLKQALESKHYKIWEKAFNLFLEGYKKTKDFDSIMKRLELVELRGRNKKKQK